MNSIEKYTFSGSQIEYVLIPSKVRSIGERSFSNCNKLKSIEIMEDSELQSISEFAFFGSKIENLYIPSKIEELKEGWCAGLSKLIYLSVSTKNENYKYVENQFLVGKSGKEFNFLVFARRDIKNALIQYISNKLVVIPFLNAKI